MEANLCDGSTVQLDYLSGSSKYADFLDGVVMAKIDDHNWHIAGIIISRCSPPAPRRDQCLAHWVDEEDNASYTLTKAPQPLPFKLQRLNDEDPVKFNPAGAWFSHVWSIGRKAMCKLNRVEEITPEGKTLQYVRSNQPRSFKVPDHYYSMTVEDKGFYIQFLEFPGSRTLREAWPTLTRRWRKHYVKALIDAVDEMATWKGDQVGSVEGTNAAIALFSRTLRDKQKWPHSFHFWEYGNVPNDLEAMGVDCSRPVFFNIMHDPDCVILESQPIAGTIGITCWEAAAYVPREYIRTHFLGRRDWILKTESKKGLLHEAYDDSLRDALLRELRARGYPECHTQWLRHFDTWDFVSCDVDMDKIARKLSKKY